MALGFTVTVRAVGTSVPQASWRLTDTTPLSDLANRVGAAEHSSGGYPYRWTFPAGTFTDADAARALGAEQPLNLRGDVIVEAWDQS